MILKILFSIAILLAGLLVFAATKPSIFRVQRSIAINAPPLKVFQLINDFHNWPEWAPQDREDSTSHRSYSGSLLGTGAISEWTSNGSAGAGRMAIVESVAPSKVMIMVDFAKPFAAHNVNQFMLEPNGATTNVTWSMNGSNLYMMKVMSVFANMDRIAGKHFEDGLANLKAAAEK